MSSTTAQFTYASYGLSAVFTDTSVPGSAAGTQITSWAWSFGDGATSGLQNPRHAYTTQGAYSVSLRIKDNAHHTTSVTHQLILDGSETSPPSVLPVIPHLSSALAVGANGAFAIWQQDTIDDVSQCVRVILDTVQGSIPTASTFGTPDPTFTQPSAHALEGIVSLWENRAKTIITVMTTDDNITTVTANVSLLKGASL